jgi:hypothetical protein
LHSAHFSGTVWEIGELRGFMKKPVPKPKPKPKPPAPKRDLSISMQKANLYSLAFAVPLVVLFSLLYIARWGIESVLEGFSFSPIKLLIFAGVLILGVIVHELIHGLTWAVFGQKSLRALKFGFLLRSLTPYAHIKEPLEVSAYRLGAIMPGWILGILPAMIGIVTGNEWMMLFGLIFTAAASGDMLVLWLTRYIGAGTLVEDHPTRAGCLIIENET